MKISEIYQYIDSFCPFSLQESWDNSGLLVGNFDNLVEKIYLSLDVDKNMLEKIDKNSLLITHHPLIFKGLKNFDTKTYPANLISIMINKNISLISIHTNFDKTHLNEFVTTEILNFKISKQENFICYVDYNDSFDNLISHVKQKFNLQNLRATKTKNFIKTLAITTGSGGDFIPYIKADCYLTGDLKYHQAICANENNLSLIDINHYESERYFPQALKLNLKNLPIRAIIINSTNPFVNF